ncbi:hypothetical protein BH11ACT3_BH11ACT3_02040 [soil metagenome]
MSDASYLVDNNALNTLTRRRVETKFFAAHCRITSDVLWEARGRAEQAELSNVTLAVEPAVFTELRRVMGTVAVGDVRLVDLFRNKGSADPGLIATILLSDEAEDGMLLRTNWILVTDDGAVAEKAAALGVKTWPSVKLRNLIDGAD